MHLNPHRCNHRSNPIPMKIETKTALPKPTPDVDSLPFWNGLKRHELVIQKCNVCSRYRFPAMPTCPYCASASSTSESTSGEGSVYSWIIVHRPFASAFADEVPYTLATIELKEGCRTVGRLEGAEEVAFGMKVRTRYIDHPNWTELRFTPVIGS